MRQNPHGTNRDKSGKSPFETNSEEKGEGKLEEFRAFLDSPDIVGDQREGEIHIIQPSLFQGKHFSSRTKIAPMRCISESSYIPMHQWPKFFQMFHEVQCYGSLTATC